MTSTYPIRTIHGAQTVPVSGTDWVSYDEASARLTADQAAAWLYARHRAGDVPVGHTIQVFATGGTLDIDVGVDTASAVDFDATAGELQTALEGLDGVAAGDVLVTGGPGTDDGDTPYVIAWQRTGLLYGPNVPDVAADPASLTGGAAVDSHDIDVDATGGTFTITIGGQTTAAVAYNAAASAVETALEALSTVTAGDVAVTGGPGQSGGGTPYVLDWSGGPLYPNDVPTPTTNAASLTGGGTSADVTANTQSDAVVTESVS